MLVRQCQGDAKVRCTTWTSVISPSLARAQPCLVIVEAKVANWAGVFLQGVYMFTKSTILLTEMLGIIICSIVLYLDMLYVTFSERLGYRHIAVFAVHS